MYALTVHAPWGGLIARHGKTVENRTTRTHHRGPLLIHQGAASAPEAWWSPGLVAQPEHARTSALLDPQAMDRGVVALVDVIGCCTDSRHLPRGDGPVCCSCGPWAMPGYAHWKLDNVRALPTPYSIPGSQGLWHAPHDLDWWTAYLSNDQRETTTDA